MFEWYFASRGLLIDLQRMKKMMMVVLKKRWRISKSEKVWLMCCQRIIGRHLQYNINWGSPHKNDLTCWNFLKKIETLSKTLRLCPKLQKFPTKAWENAKLVPKMYYFFNRIKELQMTGVLDRVQKCVFGSLPHINSLFIMMILKAISQTLTRQNLGHTRPILLFRTNQRRSKKIAFKE